jgi:hypothetical protein
MSPSNDRQDAFADGQVAKLVYLRLMSSMKEVLRLEEMRQGGRDSDPYRYFKKVVMDQFYNGMGDMFAALEKAGIVSKCPCGTTVRQGYKTCQRCNGAGYCNSSEADAWIGDRLAERRAQAPDPI